MSGKVNLATCAALVVVLGMQSADEDADDSLTVDKEQQSMRSY
jgi:hypothetical protein